MFKFNIKLNTSQIKPNSTLNPILSQHNLNVLDFCNKFKTKFSYLKDNTNLIFEVIHYNNNIININLKFMNIVDLLKKNKFNYNNNNYILLNQIYIISIYKYNLLNKRVSLINIINNIISMVHYLKIKIII